MSRRWLLLLCLIPAALGTASPSRAASAAAERSGWTLGFHVGPGKLYMDGDSLQRETGVMTDLRFDYFVTPAVAMGFGARSFSAADSGLTRSVKMVTVNGTWYPTSLGFNVRGGFGVATLTEEFIARNPFTGTGDRVALEDNGFATVVGFGYDHSLKGAFGLGLEVEYAHAGLSDGGMANLLSATASLSWNR